MSNIEYNYLIACTTVEEYHEMVNAINLELYNRFGIDKFLMANTDSDNQDIIKSLTDNDSCNITLHYLCDDNIFTAQIKAYVNNITSNV